MSYILDALKNSQDSRSRGAVPDLASQMVAVHHGPSRSERIWRLVALATVLLLLAALVVLGWKSWLAPAPSAQEMLPPMAERPAPALPAAEPQAPGLAALQQLAGVRVNVDAPQSVPPAAPAGPPPLVQKLELPMERPPLAAPAATPAPLVPSVPIRPAPPAQESLVAEYGTVEHWKQLPAPIQQQLRELPFNVHIYASDPKLRFVKTGGRTLREGDEINGELRMLHITRDGVIVGYKGGKYWMRLS